MTVSIISKPMKINKIFAIIQLSLMYVSLICMYVAVFTSTQISAELIRTLATVGLVTILVADVLALTIFNISFVSIFLRKTIDETKFVMIYKIVAIPWFVANYVLCVLMMAAFLNPFLMLAIPFVIAILSSSTYLCMISTSMMDVGYEISAFRRRIIKPNAFIIISMVLGFIFCLDLLGAIFIYTQNKKQLNCKGSN